MGNAFRQSSVGCEIKMEINITDYLEEREIKKICREAVRNRVSQLLSKENDIQRFLSNTSYFMVWEAVERKSPENMLDLIASKIPEIVNSLSIYNVFRPKDAWDRDETIGWKLLQKSLNEAEPLIKERISELIKQIDMPVIKEAVMEHIYKIIDELETALSINK
jgi:hypothetical protein